jgi:formylglycine-generating enzyme required for sulfatase activity
MMLAKAVKSTQNAEDETQANTIKMIKLMEEKKVLMADLAKLMQEKASLVTKLEMFTPENAKKLGEQIGALKKDKKNLEEKIENQREDNSAKMNEISNLNDKILQLKVQLANINIPQLPNIDTVNLPNNVNLEMVLIPSGKFTMGSPIPEVRREFETQHEVTITKPFYMGKHEVTQEQWQAIIGNNPSNTKGAKLPVTNVSWLDCQEFIKMLNKETGYGFRLPSEREWEYACRAGTTTAFSFGDKITTKDANFGDLGGPVAIGKYSANAFGLYDMHGNVWEWCETEHLVKERVFRGGSFKSDDSKYLRSYHRFWGAEDFKDPANGGFRLAKTK